MGDKKKKADKIDVRQLPPTPPNGGWGWAVVAASFFSNFLIDGVLYTFGIFLPQLMEDFESSAGTTSLVGSVLGGTYLIVGPVVSALVNRFGCRPVTICGSVISAVAFFTSAYATSISMLLFTFGVLGGIGFGMMYLPSIVMVGLYFDTKRAMATGIAVCGSGLGTMVFAPLAQKLLAEYGWRGTNKIMSGLVLNGIACGLIYLAIVNNRPPPVPETILPEDDKEDVPFRSALDVRKGSIGETNSGRATPRRRLSDTPATPHIVRKDVFYGGSVQNLTEFKASENMTSYLSSVSNIPNAAEVQKEEAQAKRRGCGARIVGMIKSLFDFKLLLSPTFLVVCLSGIFAFIGFYSPYVYLVDFAMQQGMVSSTASLLISVIGVCSIFSRLLAGWLADRPWSDSLIIHNVAAIVAGGATMLLPAILVPELLFVYSIVFGTALSAFITLRSIVLCDLLGVEKLTNSFGLCALFQGIALLAGTPLAGELYEATKSYTATFLVAGAILAMGGVVCLPARKIANWEEKRNKRKSGQLDEESDSSATSRPANHSNNNNLVVDRG